ncbi:TIGR01620 family protein [Phreatobacter sp.]|uniref:YcjF family protein n=1 Tax=Phreatobacter sp. TaxID=1966341 RepID=UPI0022C91E14|nr:TIGR01620 family protein [Phreatobacter sp.]MCZ8315150.1 TIGR01620 family protein [Phreatobacter sp.]
MTRGSQPKPEVFRLDAEAVEIAPPSDAPVPSRTVPEPAEALAAPPPQPASWWARLFWTGLGGLVTLAFGLAVSALIDDLFTRAAWLGWVGVAALALFLVGGLALAIRELVALRSLARLDDLRDRAAAALLAREDRAAGKVADDLLAAMAGNARTARGRATVAAAFSDGIVDGLQRLRIVERELLEPLDREATRLVAEAARRVSVVTAVSPRAAIDLAMVFATAVRLIRRIAELYGGRPGTLGMWKLLRHVLGHMAVTGGMAAGDTILDQLVGQGLAAKLSAKLGEGVLNGLLTARLGITAIAVTRPLPYIGAPKPDLRDLVGDAVIWRGEAKQPPRA